RRRSPGRVGRLLRSAAVVRELAAHVASDALGDLARVLGLLQVGLARDAHAAIVGGYRGAHAVQGAIARECHRDAIGEQRIGEVVPAGLQRAAFTLYEGRVARRLVDGDALGVIRR